MISEILLAAGKSKRMNGENKLTKEINSIPLINYSIKNILASSVDELIIVLGFESNILQNLIQKNNKIKIIINKNFENGMASTIKLGLENLSKKSEAFFICMADMPMISQNIYNKMIKSKFNYNNKKNIKYKKKIIIPTYNGKDGNPVLFSILMKNEIMKINGDVGARKIIDLHPNQILSVPLKSDKIFLDFDKQEDFSF